MTGVGMGVGMGARALAGLARLRNRAGPRALMGTRSFGPDRRRAQVRAPGSGSRAQAQARALGLRTRGSTIPVVMAAVTLLIILLLGAGWGGLSLGAAWRADGVGRVTVMLPDPAAASAAVARIRGQPEVTTIEVTPAAEVARLLAPLGVTAAWPLPTVLEVSLAPGADAASAASAIEALAAAAAPGAVAEAPGVWRQRVGNLGRLIVALACVALAAAVGLLVAVTAVATRSALAECWPGVVILHGMGATDGEIARCLTRGICRMAAMGAGAGIACAYVLLAAVFAAGGPADAGLIAECAAASVACGAAIVAIAGLAASWMARARLLMLP